MNYKQLQIQSYGSLIVINKLYNIVAISENAINFVQAINIKYLGQQFNKYLAQLPIRAQKIIKRNLLKSQIDPSKRRVFIVTIRSQQYFFKLLRKKNYTYLEWEIQFKHHLSTTKLNKLTFLFDPRYPNDWNSICKVVNNILNVDRTMVIQLLPNNNSKVIAEYSNTGLDKLVNTEFSKAFLDADSIAYFDNHTYRYSERQQLNQQQLFVNENDLDISQSMLSQLPLLHYLFNKHLSVDTAIYYPLYIQKQFWGLLVAQNLSVKPIDLQKRKLCLFIVQNVMNKYENYVNQKKLDIEHQFQDWRIQIQQRLHNSRNLTQVLVDSLDMISKIIHADGISLYHRNEVFSYGLTPTEHQMQILVEYLQKKQKEQIFVDDNFKHKNDALFNKQLPISGLLSYAINKEHDFFLIWFRKEYKKSIIQIDIRKNRDHPRPTFYSWKRNILNTAKSWTQDDIHFVNMLKEIISEAIIHKANQNEALQDELISINNELEMFTYTLSHDLKNPLSALKMGTKFLQNNITNLDKMEIKDWLKNLQDSIGNIEDIINQIVELSLHDTSFVHQERVPMSYLIKKICNELQLSHQENTFQISYGKLYPIWGEKSTIYQIFVNIIGNALKYAASKQNPNIYISSHLNDKYLCYTIKDNGIGIPSKDLPNLYDMFARAQNAKQFEGTGVGLSLVKRIMDRLQGKIRIESEINVGTTVYLEFPHDEEYFHHMSLLPKND